MRPTLIARVQFTSITHCYSLQLPCLDLFTFGSEEQKEREKKKEDSGKKQNIVMLEHYVNTASRCQKVFFKQHYVIVAQRIYTHTHSNHKCKFTDLLMKLNNKIKTKMMCNDF